VEKPKHLDFKIVKKRARELRSNATLSETLLWKELRNRKLYRNIFKFNQLKNYDHIRSPLYEVERGGGELIKTKI